MTRLNHNDVSRLLDAVRQVHAHADFATLPRLMVDLQSQLVPNELSSFTLMDKREQRAEVVQDTLDLAALEKSRPQFMAHYHEHPIVQHSLKTKDLQALKITDFLTQREFERTGYFNEFSRQLDIRYQVIYYLFNDADAELAMVLNRRSRDFSERDRTVANLLQPHFAQAWLNAKRFATAQQWQERAQEALRANHLGLLFLTPELRVEGMTGNCEHWLKEYFGRPAGTPDSLPDPLRRWVLQQRDFQDVETVIGQPRASLKLEGAGASLVIRFMEDAGRRVTLLLAEQRRLSAESLTGFGLTAREREVLLWISEGKSNPEIGRILGISARTVDKHVERLLAKLRVESRSAAMLKVLPG